MTVEGVRAMGLVHADIELSNPTKPELQAMPVRALVDTGAVTICIPEHVSVQLDLRAIGDREVTTADGKRHRIPYVGPLAIGFQGRVCFTGALVIGEDVLLGAVPLEDMDLVVDPRRQMLAVNPDSPNIPSVVVK